MKIIQLTKNQETLVSNEDYEYLMQWKWYALKVGYNYYAARSKKRVDSCGNQIREMYLMHRVIAERAGLDVTHLIDHEDRNSLNNQRNNLRPATQKQNMENVGLRSNNKSGFSGVFWNKKRSQWQAKITHNKKQIHLGWFKDKEDAVVARIEAEKKYWSHSEACS